MFFQRFHTECTQFEGSLADSIVEVVPELVKYAAINSDRAVAESHQHIYSRKKKKATTEAVNERTYFRPTKCNLRPICKI